MSNFVLHSAKWVIRAYQAFTLPACSLGGQVDGHGSEKAKHVEKPGR